MHQSWESRAYCVSEVAVLEVVLLPAFVVAELLAAAEPEAEPDIEPDELSVLSCDIAELFAVDWSVEVAWLAELLLCTSVSCSLVVVLLLRTSPEHPAPSKRAEARREAAITLRLFFFMVFVSVVVR